MGRNNLLRTVHRRRSTRLLSLHFTSKQVTKPSRGTWNKVHPNYAIRDKQFQRGHRVLHVQLDLFGTSSAQEASSSCFFSWAGTLRECWSRLPCATNANLLESQIIESGSHHPYAGNFLYTATHLYPASLVQDSRSHLSPSP